MKLAHPMLLLTAAMAASVIAVSPTWAGPPCHVVATGPVNQGQTFYGVKCNYPACYCTRRVCPMGIQTWCIRLQMKFH